MICAWPPHRGSCDGVYGAAFGVLGYRNHCPWFAADVRDWGKGYYRLLIGAPWFGGKPGEALDQRWENSVIYTHPKHDGANQLWEFIFDREMGYYRIRNVGRNEYLTFNPSDQRVYGFRKIENWEKDVGCQLWEKH